MNTRPSTHKVRHLAVAIGGCAVLLGVPARAERVWPGIDLPAHAQNWSLGDALEVGGVPMRIRGFLSDRPRDEVARSLRQGLGRPMVESRVGDKLILGRADGGFYLTVQLESVAGGTRAWVAVSDLESATRHRERAQSHAQAWLQRLPADSRILSQTASRDGQRLSSQLVYSNGAGAALNGRALTALMQEDGLLLQHEAAADAAPHVAPDGRVMWFKGAGKEATAVIGRLPGGRSSVVLNTVTALETMP